MRFSIQTFALLVALAGAAVEAVPHRDHDHDYRLTTKTVTKTVGKKTTTTTKTKWSTHTKYRVSTKYIKERPRTITTCPRKNDWWHHGPKTVTRTKTLTAPGSLSTATITRIETMKETLTISGDGTVITATPDATTITVPGEPTTIVSTVSEKPTTVTVPGEAETVTFTSTEEASTVTVPTTISTTVTEEATTVTIPSEPETSISTTVVTTTEKASTVTIPSEPETTTISSCAPTFTPTQLIVNPSFEEVDAARQPIGWRTSTRNTATNVVTGEVVSSNAVTGSNSYKIHCNNANVFTYQLEQTVTVETGKAYIVRLKAKSEMPSTAPSGLRLIATVEIAGISLDTAWHLPGIQISKNAYAEIVTRPVYIEKSMGNSIPVKVLVTGGAAANIAFRTAYIDDITLELVE